MRRDPYPAWIAAWGGMAALAVANGLARGLYAGRLGDTRAHQVSTATLVPAILAYAGAVDRRWPLPSAAEAAKVGVTWVGMTTAFEFGFGHYVAHQSWTAMLVDYDLRRGRLWPLVLLAAGVAPAVARSRRR
jgi:hypothetical protein